jgi:hypothetical protein
MQSDDGHQLRYRYRFWSGPNGSGSESSEESKKEVQQFVNASLGLLTAGCEICVHSQRLFCERLRRPARIGDSRCEYFARRPTSPAPDLF